MELNNDFRVSVPPVEAWKVLTDVERIAPLLPGAKLQEVEGDEYRGIVKVKVGPISAQYKGAATFLEQDQSNGHLVLKASGRDTRGQGNASATITVNMGPEGDGTKVDVVTDLTITGKVAQFGRGVLAEVTEKLIRQFVDALEADIQSGGNPDGQRSLDDAEGGAPVAAAAGDTPATDTSGDSTNPTDTTDSKATDSEATDAKSGSEGEESKAASGARQIDHPDPKPVDLLNTAGGSVAKRLLPLLGLAVVVVVILGLRRRRAQAAAAAAAAAAASKRSVLPDLSSVRDKLPDLSAARDKLPDLSAARDKLPDLSAARDKLPDLSSVQDAGRKAADLAKQAASAEVRELALAKELTTKAANRAREAALHK